MKSKLNFGETKSGADIAIIVFVVFLFLLIILVPIGGYCYTNQDKIRLKLVEIEKDTENFTSIVKGSKFYKSIKNSEKLKNIVKGDCIIAILAPWCGHCKKLKDSGILEEVGKKIPVLVLDDKHPETPVIMNELKSQGFPTIGILKNKELKNYDGPRDSSSIMDAMMS